MNQLFLLNKGKGILVLLYLIVSRMVAAALAGALHRNMGDHISIMDFYITIGVAIIFASI